MKDISTIMCDILLVRPSLTDELGIKGKDPMNNLIAKLYQDGISDAARLKEWITEILGRMFVIDVLKKLSLDFDYSADINALISI